MTELLYMTGALLLGFIGLIWSADRFVDGSAAIARNLGVSPLIVGLTIVSLGTSAPEILVSVNAAFSGAGELAIGNALGSNLANVGLVLGVTALFGTLPVQKNVLLHELPILLGVTIVAGWFLSDGRLGRTESAILLGLLLPILWYLVWVKRKTQAPEALLAGNELPQLSQRAALLRFIVGLAVLVLSARILVWGATALAGYAGVSPLVIGLTVVAVGTSLPELAASVMSAMRGHHDIALGNVIGSNIFNLLAVMSIPSLIHPLNLDANVFYRDYLAMAGITLLLALTLLMSLRRVQAGHTPGINRWHGGLFLLCYTFYYYYLFTNPTT